MARYRPILNEYRARLDARVAADEILPKTRDRNVRHAQRLLEALVSDLTPDEMAVMAARKGLRGNYTWIARTLKAIAAERVRKEDGTRTAGS